MKLYILPEYMHPFENCQKCLCAMCDEFYKSGCRACPMCYYLGGIVAVKYCRFFCPCGVDLQVKDWYRQDEVIQNPNFNTVFP